MPELDHQEKVREIARGLRAARRVVVLTHVRPDGDAWSSARGLVGALKRLNIDAAVAGTEPVSHALSFLEGAHDPVLSPHDAERFQPDVVVLVDCATIERAGFPNSQGEAPFAKARLYVIDHHENPPDLRAFALIDPRAAAAAELVVDVVTALGVAFDASLASTLLAGMMTDSASFQLANTTPSLLRKAAAMVEAGADIGMVAGRLFRTRNYVGTALWGKTLSTLQSRAGGQIAYVTLLDEFRKATGGVDSDINGRAAFVLSIEGVRIGILFREDGPLRTRVSVRTENGLSAVDIARIFGGGGHLNAAGFTVEGSTLVEAQVRVLAAAEALVAAYPWPRVR
jgi:phosphoesterase RecJ-like protein